MRKNPSKNTSESGLELDKLEILERSSPKTAVESTADSGRESTLSSETGSSGKRHLWLALAAVTVTLALLTAIAIYMKKQDLKVSVLTLKKTSFSESYLRVGPITATIQNDEIMRLSLDIGCKNDAAKKRLAEKDPRVRDKIVSIITAPDTKTFLKNHQYEAVRAKIKESLEKIYDEPIGEVYFAELLTY